MYSDLLKELRLHYPEEVVMQFVEETHARFAAFEFQDIQENAEQMKSLLNAALAKFCPKMQIEGIRPVAEVDWAYDDSEDYGDKYKAEHEAFEKFCRNQK